jgi:integrating conjugative element membrane protein (TIGR03747 family)
VICCTLLCAGNIILTFLLRLTILLQALPLFALMIVVGLLDGLVRRDLRRFDAGHESGFVYHHARHMISFSLIATGVVWLAVSIFLVPEYVFIPAAIGIGLAVSITGGSFKKHV